MNPQSLKFSPSSPKSTPSKRRILGEITNNLFKSPNTTPLYKSPVIERLKQSPLIDRSLSPVTSKVKSTNKITRIFEERTQFKMDKENKENIMSETFMKLDVEEETRDSFGDGFVTNKTWSNAKLDFTDALQSKLNEEKNIFVPENDDADLDSEFTTLHDLEQEFDNDNFDQCTKYEIISTDSPDIISRGRSSTSRKVTSRNFVFGAPLAENEQSTSFNRPNANATRMLNFEDESFEFTSPAAKRPSTSNMSVKKSLKFTETPTKNPLRHEKSDSSIGSMSSSPASSRLRIFTSESTTSMESGFISELEEPFLDIEEASNSPKVANFNDLLSGQIKDNILVENNFLKRPSLQRSMSLNPESKARVSLFSILESPQKKSVKRVESVEGESVDSKRRKQNPGDEEEREPRPMLQRAYSENNASIMSALARSAREPDLIGDFSAACALPLARGAHPDLRAVSARTLAGLLAGRYRHCVHHFQVIDCRYPYEFAGGHIVGARNLYTRQHVRALLHVAPRARCVLVFHCEHSLERGPNLCRYLRSLDREENMDNYPNLYYPEVYVLHEGYRTFYKNYPEFCTPNGYTTMLDPKHRHLLRKLRSDPSSSRNRLDRNRLLL
ncbi:M-phase inducer phosphatase-like isoform X2 [Plodia interpunctella]|nr:M-phase inducer phosphatase-like isoform X2 [Plodia interpunctella]XP_053622272.1 M-phase inducer phosphatase-like isoform X2 [Plodia interpunctella]